MTAMPLAESPSTADEEMRLRRELAATYRLVARFRMTDLIFTHISVRLPGPENHFLINPYGLLFEEITASSLVKIDLSGRAVDATPHPVNPAGFVIHGAIHAARADAHCVLHTRTQGGCAVAAQEQELLPLNQISREFLQPGRLLRGRGPQPARAAAGGRRARRPAGPATSRSRTSHGSTGAPADVSTPDPGSSCAAGESRRASHTVTPIHPKQSQMFGLRVNK
jgi:hypothetical protein